jgi:hypothetical protein
MHRAKYFLQWDFLFISFGNVHVCKFEIPIRLLLLDMTFDAFSSFSLVADFFYVQFYSIFHWKNIGKNKKFEDIINFFFSSLAEIMASWQIFFFILCIFMLSMIAIVIFLNFSTIYCRRHGNDKLWNFDTVDEKWIYRMEAFKSHRAT